MVYVKNVKSGLEIYSEPDCTPLSYRCSILTEVFVVGYRVWSDSDASLDESELHDILSMLKKLNAGEGIPDGEYGNAPILK